MKAFISYSTQEKHIAGQIKSILNELQIDSFLAHDDIEVSQEWKERIVEELKESHFVIPLFSKSFKSSDWGAQEIGLAYSRKDVLFIPLCIDDTTPFGFLAHLQGKHIPDSGPNEAMIIDPIIKGFPRKIIPQLIKRLGGASGFRHAEELMCPLVPHFEIFDEWEITKFTEACIENGQIWSARDCSKIYLPKFLEIHQSQIQDGLFQKLKYQIENGEWYRPGKKV